jgi:hypothetical protein
MKHINGLLIEQILLLDCLIEMARCADCPGPEPISYADAIALIKKALQIGPFVDGIGLLRTLYRLTGDKEQEIYWAKMLKDCYENAPSPSIEPEFLENEYFQKEKGIEGTPTLERFSIFYRLTEQDVAS